MHLLPRPPALVALLTLVAACGCSRAPTDPVLALLAELESAAEVRDAERFAEGLSETFSTAEGLGKADAIIELKRYFAAYEKVGIETYGVETEREDGEAHVRCVVDFSGDTRKVFGLQGFLPPDATYRFSLDVADEDGTWRVRSVRWEAVLDAPPVVDPGT